MTPTEEARKEEIAAKARASNENLSIPWQNERLVRPVITISLENILLNPRSHRIRSQIESHPESSIFATDPYSPLAQEVISAILRLTPEFPALKEDLGQRGQVDAGIVTHAGVLINANTRAVALRDIGEQYIRVAVLPDSATDHELTELEARLQLSRDFKQPYSLTNELLFIREQLEAGTSKRDLALLLGKTKSTQRAQMKKGIEEIEKSDRILLHIRELQEASGGKPPLVFFDDHESALSEADSAYLAARDRSETEANRVRQGRMLGILSGVTYRNLRFWDSDSFLHNYVEPQFQDDESALSRLSTEPTSKATHNPTPTGASLLEGLDSNSGSQPELDLDSLVALIAATRDDPLAQVAPGLSAGELKADIADRITQAAEERDADKRDERRAFTPTKLIQEARKKVKRAEETLISARSERDFESGKLLYECKRLRKELDSLIKKLEDE